MMKGKNSIVFIGGAILLLLVIFFAITYNGLVKKDEKVKQQWNEMQNAYQRRLDLIPNLVNVVKGGAAFEQTTLVQITEVRTKATAVSAGAGDVSAEGYEAQKAAQDALAAAANRLLITVEKYPELQGAKAFGTLQTQLERTELRIKIARKDFNESIQSYNNTARNFPTKIVAGMFGFKPKAGFAADAGSEKATEIKF